MTKYMGLHETLEIHELLIFKNLSLTKSIAMRGLVQDPELKAILSNEVDAATSGITRLKEFLTERNVHNE